jgi:hypothetical protein
MHIWTIEVHLLYTITEAHLLNIEVLPRLDRLRMRSRLSMGDIRHRCHNLDFTAIMTTEDPHLMDLRGIWITEDPRLMNLRGIRIREDL